jgi:hypothetical protein
MSSNRPPDQYNAPPSRPVLISVIGYLEVILGFVYLIYSAFLFFSLWIGGAFAAGFSGAVAGFFTGLALGGFELIIALITLAVGYGLLRGAPWAWTLAVFISAIDAIVGIVQIAGVAVPTLRIGIIGLGFGGVATLIISVAVLYYLYRPNVKSFFGKS